MLAQGVPIRDDTGRILRWAGINLDISRLKNTERALIEADRRKDEFLATLAHELRNPLAPIRNAVRILDSAAADERQRKWGREVIARQVQRMSLLLDDLLDVSRITQNRMQADADRRADLDLQVSLLTEHELTRLVTLVRSIAERTGVDVSSVGDLEEIQRDVAPERVLDTLEQKKREHSTD